MKNIKENKRVIGEKAFWTTNNPDIIIETTTTAKEINLKELKERKANLESLISNQPKIEDLVAMEKARQELEVENLQAELDKIDKDLVIYG
jgi:hypothetical protein